jgi:hypothetical protein
MVVMVAVAGIMKAAARVVVVVRGRAEASARIDWTADRTTAT